MVLKYGNADKTLDVRPRRNWFRDIQLYSSTPRGSMMHIFLTMRNGF